MMGETKDDLIRKAIDVLEYVYRGMKSPEEKTQIAGAMYYLEKALNKSGDSNHHPYD